MARMCAAIIGIIIISSQGLGQSIGIRIGTVYHDGDFYTQRLEASFTNPIIQDVEVMVSTGVLTAFAQTNSGYAVPLVGGLKYTFLESKFAPYCALEYGVVLNVRVNNHSRMTDVIKAGVGIEYPLQDKLLLDVSAKLVGENNFANEIMAGIRFRL